MVVEMGICFDDGFFFKGSKLKIVVICELGCIVILCHGLLISNFNSPFKFVI